MRECKYVYKWMEVNGQFNATAGLFSGKNPGGESWFGCCREWKNPLTWP
jgi:hypothetical protein